MTSIRSLDSDRPQVEKSSPLRSVFASIVVGVLCMIGGAAIVGWALPNAAPAKQAHARSIDTSNIEKQDPKQELADMTSSLAQPSIKSRRRATCADCGVIESIRRIDRREEMLGSCNLGDSATIPLNGGLVDGGQRLDLVTLSDTVHAAVGSHTVAKRIHVVTQHQIVVRFRDGTRRVFNEETPRTLQVGEGIRVIAGVTAPRG